MKISKFIVNPFQENTYVVWDETNECLVIDAGNLHEEETNALASFVEKNNLKVAGYVCTHGHVDHTTGLQALINRFPAPFHMSSLDEYLLQESNAFGIKFAERPRRVDVDLNNVSEIKFGKSVMEVIKTPGHTPGGICLLSKDHKYLFSGDTLFKGSIGRTDLEGGSYHDLMKSLINNIIKLGDEVKVFPGHGDETTIGQEVLYNPFISEVINEEVKY